jgi:hypothetical protein
MGDPASQHLSPRASLGDPGALTALSDSPGVHVVFRPDGRPLFVGMSSQTRTRVRRHLTGNRQSSILHQKVGRLLDRELGRTASRDEIRDWLQECSFAVTYTDDPNAAKSALVLELAPELNEIVP